VITVLVADDQELVREGFKLMLDVEPDIEIVAEAADGVQAVDQARTCQPDVVLMDIRMPTLDGLEATRSILQSGVRSRVLMLTTYDADEYLHQALRAGASGFLLKDARREDLTHAIRTVAAGDALLHPALTRRLMDRFSRGPDPRSGSRLPQLTDRENDVLRLVARGHTNAEIAAQLYLSESTVKTHLASITQKLRLRDRVHAVILAYEHGIAVPGEPGPAQPSQHVRSAQ
jgi:DNA-binding NarL/FixJ family response regulator